MGCLSQPVFRVPCDPFFSSSLSSWLHPLPFFNEQASRQVDPFSMIFTYFDCFLFSLYFFSLPLFLLGPLLPFSSRLILPPKCIRGATNLIHFPLDFRASSCTPPPRASSSTILLAIDINQPLSLACNHSSVWGLVWLFPLLFSCNFVTIVLVFPLLFFEYLFCLINDYLARFLCSIGVLV